MRTTTLAKSLLIGSALACGPLAAQQTTVPPGPQEPTAPVTVPATSEDETPAQPSASVTLVAQPPGTLAPAPTTPPQATSSTTVIVPADVPTTIATGVPTTIATGVPTTVATGVPTTTATGVPTTVATGVPMPPGAVAPATTATTTATIVPGTPATSATIPAPAVPATGGIIDPATYQKRTEFDNTPWRFNMEQDGKRMTADEFTAWMKARGVRVARGPAAHRPENPTRDGMAGQGSTLPSGAMGTPTASTTLVVAPAADGLAPGSVEPTDAWSGTDQPDDVTTSATILVPVPPPAEPVVEPVPAPPPVNGDEAQ